MSAVMEQEMMDGYKAFRGRCREMSDAACRSDSSLTLVRGHYYCPMWNTEEPHWWTVRQDGTIHDPTKDQFPSRGLGVYTPFDGLVECADCGKQVKEEDADIEGRYAFCSYQCHGRFVGVF